MWNTNLKQLEKHWKEDAYYSRTITVFCYQKWVELESLLKPIRRSSVKVSMFVFVAVACAYVFLPTTANADIEQESGGLAQETISLILESMQNETRVHGRLPVSQDSSPRRQYKVAITAYTSDPRQTDDTPCLTASGLDVCERGIENIVAANFLPIGTRVRIPELYGDRIFYVEDRMNARYHYRMDVWMKEIAQAKEFGIQRATIEVF